MTQNICFSDKVTFFLFRFPNKHNCRYLDNENPHVFDEGNTQFRQNSNVWTGIFGDDILESIFIEAKPDWRIVSQHITEM